MAFNGQIINLTCLSFVGKKTETAAAAGMYQCIYNKLWFTYAAFF